MGMKWKVKWPNEIFVIGLNYTLKVWISRSMKSQKTNPGYFNRQIGVFTVILTLNTRRDRVNSNSAISSTLGII